MSLRSLGRSPAFTLTAVGSVGLGVGLACSVYAVANAALFTPSPYAEVDQLVEIWPTARPGSDQPIDYLTAASMLDWAGAEMRTLEGVAGRGMTGPLILIQAEGALRVASEPIIGDWFGTLGVGALRGRTLVEADADPRAEPAAVVSESLWRDRLSANEEYPGATLSLSGTAFTVVGIMPDDFDRAEKVWIPVATLPSDRRPAAYGGVARLRGPATVADATLEISQLAAAQVARDSARFGGFGATARPLGTFGSSDDSPSLWVLVGVAAAVLLVGLSNLTHLFLVRAQQRSASLAVRASLGANQLQLGAAMLVEGLFVAMAGGLLGLVVAIGGKDLIGALLPGTTSRADPAIGAGVIGLALGLTLLAVAAAGLEPLRRLGGLDLRTLLQRGPGSTLATPGERRTRNLMVVTQVATSVVLLATATLQLTAWRRFTHLDVGYDAERVVVARPDWDLLGTLPTEQWALARGLAPRLQARPEVEGVVVWRQVGMNYPPRPEWDAVFDGAPLDLEALQRLYLTYEVEPGTIEALGVPLLRGRTIAVDDVPGSPPVAVITRSGAEAWWPDEDPLGHQVKLGENGTWMTVVGVVENMESLGVLGRPTARRTLTRGQSAPILFSAARQDLGIPVGWHAQGNCAACYGVMLAARASGSPADAATALREEIATAAPGLPLLEIRTFLDGQITGYYREAMLLPGRLAAIGVAVALVLALVGIVGMVSDGVSRRTREIGVRVALGAPHSAVMGTVAREALVTTGAGLALGIFAVIGLHRALADIVFSFDTLRLGAEALRPSLLATTCGAVLLAAAAAALTSARRALSIDPVEALRSE